MQAYHHASSGHAHDSLSAPVFHYIQVTDHDPHQAPIRIENVQRVELHVEHSALWLYIPGSVHCPRKKSVLCHVHV
jgi:hypothetical protein